MNFQWFRNGAAVPGAQTLQLTIANTNLQFIDGILGDYSLFVSNTAGAVTSRVARLKDRAIWPKADGGNGHGYTAWTASQTWDQAYQRALSSGGMLACLETAEENSFVFSLIDRAAYWVNNLHGPWLGGYQPPNSTEPGGGWRWLSDVPFGFTSWNVSPRVGIDPNTLPEPNNSNGNENRLCFFMQDFPTRMPNWNDESGNSALPSFVIEFPEQIQLIAQPTNRVSTVGATVNFRVAAASLSPISYQWQKDGNALVGETNAILTLTNVQPGAIGDYRVWVSNSAGSVTSSVASLNLSGGPDRQAKATAQVVNGFVVGVAITGRGFGYTEPPVVHITGGGGTGATATATVANGVVTGITIINPGTGYTGTPTVAIASPPFTPELQVAVSRVNVTLKVVLGLKYLLESSNDLATWTAVNAPFVAESEELTREFVVEETGQFFRITQVP